MEKMVKKNSEEVTSNVVVKNDDLNTRVEIIDEGIRKKYLTRLSELEIAPIDEILPLEEDLINNVRLYCITEMVYQKGVLVCFIVEILCKL